MPLYDYRCPNCDQVFEARHSISAAAPGCPKCGFAQVTRIITSAPAVAGGIVTPAGSSRGATKEEIQSKWQEESPKLQKKLEDKLGKDTVQRLGGDIFKNNSSG